jgi:hypothetical protein
MIGVEAEIIRHATLEAGAKEFLERAKAAIGTYEYGWAPLSPDTIRRKTTGDSPGLETSAMKDSGSYEVHYNSAVVGFTDPKTHLFEFGTSRQPPRPIIGGTIDHHGAEIAEHMGIAFGMIMGETIAMGNVGAAARHVQSIMSSLKGFFR